MKGRKVSLVLYWRMKKTTVVMVVRTAFFVLCVGFVHHPPS